jgi:hypothetical protein
MTTTEVLRKVRRYQPIVTILNDSRAGNNAKSSLDILEAVLLQYNPRIDETGWVGYTLNINVEDSEGFWSPEAEIQALILWLKETKPLYQNYPIVHVEFVKSIMWFEKAFYEMYGAVAH